ncbi:GNAT family N-acetyltransferase [Marinomonas sp. 2405UD68-3]|uniref:GNAT family N-acetyltransferase n=1 Tax=Marinomonas sp. 2405UD68-3 TaxID=3391835 RepID=UPI0039C9AB38
MPDEIIIKEIIEDTKKIGNFLDMYRQFYGEISDIKSSISFIGNRIISNESVIFVAQKKEKIIGFIQLFPSFSSVTLQKMFIVNDLYVSDKCRGQGVGRALLKESAHYGISKNIKQLFIEGAVSNVKARGLYEDFGFILNSDYMYYHYPINKKVI